MKQLAALGARLILAAAFLSAGWPKANDPAGFIRDLWGYRLMPESLAYWVAAYLPYLEIIVALALFPKALRSGARLLATVLLGTFTAALISAQLRGLDISCGCFGSSAPASTLWPSVVRNLLLLACLALETRWSRPVQILPSPPVEGEVPRPPAGRDRDAATAGSGS